MTSLLRFLLLPSIVAIGILTLFTVTPVLQDSVQQSFQGLKESKSVTKKENPVEDSSNNKHLLCTPREDWKDAIHAWMHIPKTAGTSGYRSFMMPLDRLSYQVYPSPKSKWYDWNTPGCPGPAPYGGTHCARSEINSCLTEILFPQNKTAFHTIIRHPVNRVLSEYFWWRNSKAHAWTDSMAAKHDNITEWVLDETNLAHNRQAVYFLMDTGYNSNCTAFVADKTLSWIQTNFGSTAALNNHTIAHQDLDKFASVSVLEEMQKSKQAFNRLVGKNISTGSMRAKGGDHRSTKEFVPQRVKNLILERNQLDMMLYRMAVERLNAC